MKLSNETIKILENFSAINPSIIFKKGNELRTISTTKAVFAKATVKEQFEQDCGIYNLSQFLSTLKIFSETPELTWLEDKVEFSSGKEKVTYRYAAPELIVAPPSKNVQFPTADLEFKLQSVDLLKLLKAADVFGSPHISIVGDGTKFSIQACNVKNSSENVFKIDLGTTDLTFNFIFSRDNIKLKTELDYDVMISSKGISSFSSPEISYIIAVEQDSKFG